MRSHKRALVVVALMLGAAGLVAGGCHGGPPPSHGNANQSKGPRDHPAPIVDAKDRSDLAAENNLLRRELSATSDEQKECLRLCREAHDREAALCNEMEEGSEKQECLRAALERWIACTDKCIVPAK